MKILASKCQELVQKALISVVYALGLFVQRRRIERHPFAFITEHRPCSNRERFANVVPVRRWTEVQRENMKEKKMLIYVRRMNYAAAVISTRWGSKALLEYIRGIFIWSYIQKNTIKPWYRYNINVYTHTHWHFIFHLI